MNKSMDEKISEHRFQWIFSEKLSDNEITSYYLNVKHSNNFKFLVKRYPGLDLKHFDTVIGNRDNLPEMLLFTELWNLKDLTNSKRQKFFVKLDQMLKKEKSNYKREKYLYRIYLKNKDLWHEREAKVKAKSYSYIQKNYMNEDKPRFPASILKQFRK